MDRATLIVITTPAGAAAHHLLAGDALTMPRWLLGYGG